MNYSVFAGTFEDLTLGLQIDIQIFLRVALSICQLYQRPRVPMAHLFNQLHTLDGHYSN